MHYDFIAIPDSDVPHAVDPVFQHVVTTYASEVNKTVSTWRAVPEHLLDFKPHEDQPGPHHLGPPTSFRAAILCSVRRNRGAARRRTLAFWRQAERGSLHREVHLAGETPAAAVGAGNYRLVAGAAELLRWLAAGTDLGVLATCSAHLPSSDAGAIMAAPGRLRTCASDLRAVR